MVLTENSSTMELLQDSEGDHITIHAMKNASTGTRILSNNDFLDSCSSTDKQTTISKNKYADVTAVSQNEKYTLSSLDDVELSRMVNDMINDQYTTQEPFAVENIPQSIYQEQVQLLESYNDIIDLPQDVQIQLICGPVDTKETSEVNSQQIHKSHLLPWLSEEYTQLIQPSKQRHVVTIKKIKARNISKTDIISDNGMIKDKGNINEKQNLYEKNVSLGDEIKDLKKISPKNLSLGDESKDLTEISQKNTPLGDESKSLTEIYQSVIRERGVQEIKLESHKEICNKWKEQPHATISVNSHSSTDVMNRKENESMLNKLPSHSIQSSQAHNKIHELDHLSDVSMSNSNENIIIPQLPSMPIISSGESLETQQSTITDNQTSEHKIIIQELKNMVPLTVYPHQTLKTFENGKVLLVAPLNSNKCNTQRMLLEPKEMDSIIKSEIKGTSEINEIKVHAYNQHNTIKQYDMTNFSKKRKISDLINCDMKSGIKKTENCQDEDELSNVEKKKKRIDGLKVREKKKWQLEEEFSDAEEEKKRVNAIKAKEHRERKKGEINELKKENMQWQLKYKDLEAENKQLKSTIEMMKSLFQPALNINSCKL